MTYDWDETKEMAILRQRGFGFAFAVQIFEGETIETIDARRDYGEVRVRATGAVGDRLITVVYSDDTDVRRIITAWPASRQERRKWQSRG